MGKPLLLGGPGKREVIYRNGKNNKTSAVDSKIRLVQNKPYEELA